MRHFVVHMPSLTANWLLTAAGSNVDTVQELYIVYTADCNI